MSKGCSPDIVDADNMITYPILPWQRLWPVVGVFLWAHINECPLLQQHFPVLLFLDTAVWVQNNTHPQCTCSSRNSILLLLRKGSSNIMYISLYITNTDETAEDMSVLLSYAYLTLQRGVTGTARIQ